MTMQNHFALFNLPAEFALDTAQLDAAYREVQNKVHPDKFVYAPDAEKRVAMQWATRANEAYQILKSPFRRAAYLVELHGIDLQVESNTAMPRAFLMQQMEWREALDDCKALKVVESKIEGLEKLLEEVDASHAASLKQIASLIDADQNFSVAVGQVRALMFIEKFAQEVQHQLDASS
jgi:molecular chaperone HscB